MKRTVIACREAMYENILVWIEDVDIIELPFKDRVCGPNPFSTVGGALNTNTGMRFTKKMLQEIVNNMSNEGELFICSPHKIDIKPFFQENK